MYPLPSIAFSEDYCIFVSKKAAPHFAEKARLTSSMRCVNVQVWESVNKEDDLAVITIPKYAEFWKIEQQLFDYKNKETHKDVIESGFLGQPNIGYTNKEWNLVE